MANTLTVGRGPFQGETNAAIQQAIDQAAAGPGGGVVIVPPGVYRLDDAVHLRSNVRLVGQAGAVLRKVPSVSSPIADCLGYGHYEFTLAGPEADKFRAGMGVHLLDDNAGGFYTTVATIVGRDGERFFIDNMLNHDYLPRANGRVVSAFSLIEAVGVQDAAVEGFVLDGGWPGETFKLNGCRGGGVFLLQSRRVTVSGVEVANYNGDGISFQQCVDIAIRDCRVHHVTGHGLHPGSGSVRYLVRAVESDHNGRCGVYYCLRTTHSILERCRLGDNGEAGISIGERDTDHLLRDNRIGGNAGCGILFRKPGRRGGDRLVIRNNAIGPNGVKDGLAEIVIPSGLNDVLIEGNAFAPGGDKAVRVEPGCRGICVAGNTVGGSPQGPGHIAADERDVSLLPPASFPPVGPAALPLDGARHLNQPALAPWAEVS